MSSAHSFVLDITLIVFCTTTGIHWNRRPSELEFVIEGRLSEGGLLQGRPLEGSPVKRSALFVVCYFVVLSFLSSSSIEKMTVMEICKEYKNDSTSNGDFC